MEEQPSQIPANRLHAMLGGAKALMQKVETGSYETGNVSLDTSVTGDQLVETAGGQGQAVQGGINTTNVAPKLVDGAPVYKNMNTSKLPDNIKKAMMEQPIAQIGTPNHTFNLEDVQDLVDKPLPLKMANPKSSPQMVQESTQQTVQHVNDRFTVSETALRGIVKDIVKGELLEFMSETFAKQLSEQTIKKTINTLIKEGKISTKKKIRS